MLANIFKDYLINNKQQEGYLVNNNNNKQEDYIVYSNDK